MFQETGGFLTFEARCTGDSGITQINKIVGTIRAIPERANPAHSNQIPEIYVVNSPTWNNRCLNVSGLY